MKRVREHLYEKFEKEGDPIHQMDIGPQDEVYRCGNCGNILDAGYDNLPEDSEEFETAQTIMNIFGENSDRVHYVQCNSCRAEEEDRQQQEEYARYQEQLRQQEQEDYYRWHGQDRFRE